MIWIVFPNTQMVLQKFLANFVMNHLELCRLYFFLFGYRFFFWSNDHEPIHIHVSKGDSEAKFNVINVELIDNYGFKKNELRLIESLIEENKEVIIARWKEYFKKDK